MSCERVAIEFSMVIETGKAQAEAHSSAWCHYAVCTWASQI